MPDITVEGIVAQRNNEPYVVFTVVPDKPQGKNKLQQPPIRLQWTVQDARKIAEDILLQAARIEMDGCLCNFLKNTGAEDDLFNAMMLAFRDYRLKWDEQNKPDNFMIDPDTGEKI